MSQSDLSPATYGGRRRRTGRRFKKRFNFTKKRGFSLRNKSSKKWGVFGWGK
jgi:hypothetical protein